VDIVMRLDDRFNYDLSNLDEAGKARFLAVHPNLEYGYTQFKAEVLAWLTQTYGTSVKVGTKAIRIAGSNSRRDADVLPCLQFRRYWNFNTASDQRFAEGICFYRSDGVRIENFPKQHLINCTTKHQATNGYFKPMVRIFKNMRNRMIVDGLIKSGLAPSYYLEGMLYNVPTELFSDDYGKTWVRAVNWLRVSKKSDLLCANGLHYLLRERNPVTRREVSFDTFLTSAVHFWNNW
jgi:hypothetical protein